MWDSSDPKGTILLAQFTHNGDVVIIYYFRYVQSGTKCFEIGRRAWYPRKQPAHDLRNGVIYAVDARHLPKAACRGTLPLHGHSEDSVLGNSGHPIDLVYPNLSPGLLEKTNKVTLVY